MLILLKKTFRGPLRVTASERNYLYNVPYVFVLDKFTDHH